jgi:hypothetical protein
MKTTSYIFGRVLSSEVSRGLAQYHKGQELRHVAADGQAALKELKKWMQTHPEHPLIARFEEEVGKINNDLRLTDETRGTKMSIVAQNTWRLAQEEDKAQKALTDAQDKEAKAQAQEAKILNAWITQPKSRWLRVIFYLTFPLWLLLAFAIHDPVAWGMAILSFMICSIAWTGAGKVNRARKEAAKKAVQLTYVQ